MPLKDICNYKATNKVAEVLWPAFNIVHMPLQWRHNGRDSVSKYQPHDCLLKRLFRRSSKKTSKLRVTGLCAGNSPGTGEFPAQMASNAENVSIWWRHHDCYLSILTNRRMLFFISAVSTYRFELQRLTPARMFSSMSFYGLIYFIRDKY